MPFVGPIVERDPPLMLILNPTGATTALVNDNNAFPHVAAARGGAIARHGKAC